MTHKHAPYVNTRHVAALLSLLVLLLLILLPAAEATDSAESIITQAWQRAQDSGSYAFHSTVDQTTYPVPSLRNSGRQPIVDQIGLAGSVDLLARTIQMTFWPDASFDPAHGVSVRAEGNHAYQRRNEPGGSGTWEEIDNVANAFAPGGDPLGFLAGIKNVQVGETRMIGIADTERQATQYLFDLDGPVYAAYLRDQMEQLLHERGRLPAGLRLSTSAVYARMDGSGELWIDGEGLPLRLVVHLDLPQQTDIGRITAAITTDLSNFDRDRLGAATTGFLVDPLLWTTFHWVDAGVGHTVRTMVIVLAGMVLLGLVVVRYGHTRRFYTVIAVSFVAVTLFTPLLQIQQTYAFSDAQAAETAAHERRVAQSEAVQQVQSGGDDQWNPHADPRASSLRLSPSTFSAPALRATVAFTDTTDSDGDGLIDFDEAVQGTCDGVDVGTNPFCDGVVDPTDSDGDGLSDGLEVLEVGTLPTVADSDRDGITDTLEIQGFSYDGLTTWYLNPREADTNQDGLDDGAECAVWNAAIDALFNPSADCQDSDDDGTPDVFDEDNDNDGVPDSVDLSPFRYDDQTYNGANPFALQVDNVAIDQPLYVDIQIRPNNADNLRLYYHVLDWPAGDTEGQIQRRLTTTWADTDSLDLRSAAPNAGNGDIRIVPMLEVTMPYTDGHYANLPITTTAPTQRVLGDTVTTWLDDDQIDPFSITVNDVDLAAGTLAAYVPLAVSSDKYDRTHAFSARMFYRPSQGTDGRADWGAAHQYRLVWLIQMLTDECVDPTDDIDTCDRQDVLSVVHAYQDDWRITGLHVSEQQRLDTAILYEDPATDSNLEEDNQLIVTSWNLSNTFLRGRDCDTFSGGTCNGDDALDVTVANMATEVPIWFPGNNEVAVETFNYEHEAQLGLMVSREATRILAEEFDFWAGFDPVTLLYAYEREDRSLNLNELAPPSGNLTVVDLDPDTIGSLTRATLSAMPYQYVDDAWTAMDPASYLDLLDYKLSQDAFFQPADDSVESLSEAAGQMVWAQLYYGTLIQGITTVISADGQLTFTPSDDLTEDEYDPIVSPGTSDGFATVITAFAQPYTAPLMGQLYGALAKIPGLSFLASAYPPETQAVFDTLYKLFGTFNPLSAMVLLAGATGLSLMVIGYLTDDAALFRTGEIIMASVTIVIVLVQLLVFYAAMRVAITTAQGAAAVAGAMLNAAKGFRAMGAVGLLIGLLVTWGFAAFTILSEGQTGIERNVTISMALALTIVALVLFLIGFLGLGILGLILSLVDAIFLLLGKKGPTQYLVEWLAGKFYDVDMLVTNIDSADRLDIDLVDMSFVDPLLGFTQSNDVIITLDVTNAIKYRKSFGKGEAKEHAVFRYFLEATPADHHDGLTVGEMEDEWTFVGNRTLTDTKTLSITVPLSTLPTGLGSPPTVYLNEAYIASYRGCWLATGNDSDCRWDKEKDTTHIDLGDMLALDVMPATIDDFVRLNWNHATDLNFPPQSDYDADGLTTTDPNDREIDTDGDTLTDFYELANGLDPEQADGDEDGLNDAEELRFATNAYVADSDGDGLEDGVEALDGWLVTYDTDKVMRVWSDPLAADVDADDLDDLTEFIYGFHPGVPTDPSAIDNLVQLTPPILLEDARDMVTFLRFEELAGSWAYLDSSGSGNSAACTLATTTCPGAGGAGRYGNGLFFDGLNDFIELQFTDGFDFSNGAFAQAAWIYPTPDDNGDKGIMGKSGTPAQYPPTLSVIDQTALSGGFGDGTNWNSFTTGPVLTTDAWNHVAATYDGTTYRVYVDAIEVYSTVDWAGATPYPNTGLNIGRKGIGTNFDGGLDEIAIFAEALDATAIAELMAGRVNPGDLIVEPGAALTYQATVTNTLATQGADGFLVAATEPISPAVPLPDIALHLDGEERIKKYTPDTSNSSTLRCIDDGITCPADFGGRYGRAIRFDGADDVATFPTLNVREEGDIDWHWDYFTLSFWVRVETLPPAGERTYLLDTNPQIPGALDIYLDSDGWIWFEMQDTIIVSHNTFASAYDNFNLDAYLYYENLLADGPAHGAHGLRVFEDSAQLNRWHNFVFTYFQGDPNSTSNNISYSLLYADYPEFLPTGQLSSLDYEIRGAEYDGLRLGPGTVGTGNAGNFYDGGLDEIAIFNGFTIFNGDETALIDLYDGNYNTQGASPSFLLRFDPATETVGYVDDVSDVERTYCDSSAECPSNSSSGARGDALSFDGVDDSMWLGPMDFPKSDYTIAGWFNTDLHDFNTFLGALDPTNSDNPGISMGLRDDGTVEYTHYFPASGSGAVTASSAPGYNDGAWHHFAAVREGDTSTLYLNGVAVDAVTGSNPAEIMPNIRLGRLKDPAPGRYDGQLDDLIIIPAALDAGGVQALLQTGWPAIEIPDAFVPYEVGPLSSFVVSGTADVSDSAISAHHRFDQEVEAAINLQQLIDIPIIDDNVGNVKIFAPFEDVPGETVFENIAGNDELTCPTAANCPQAGLRGIIDRAALFDGDDDYLVVADTTQMLSFSAWVKADRGVVLDTHKNYPYAGIELDVAQLRVHSGGNGNEPADHEYTLALDLNEGAWNHIVVTVDKSSNTVTLYVNGATVDTINYSGNDPYTGRPTIGGATKGGDYLHGYLDDFRAYNIVLSAADVQSLYQNSPAVLRFEFDEPDDALVFSDSSPNGFIGTPATVSAPTSGEPTLNPAPGVDGKIGNIATFHAEPAMRVSPDDDSALDLDDLTIMLWVKPDGTRGPGVYQNLLSKHDSSGAMRNYQLNILPETLRLAFSGQTAGCSSFFSSLQATTDLLPGYWTHVAVTFDGNSAEIYLNGELDNSRNYADISLCKNDFAIVIGGGFLGEMDELALYGRSLSVAEVNSIYLRELRWYRATSSAFVTVDTEAPTVALLSNDPYRKNGYIQLVVAAHDVWSHVQLLDFGIKAPGDTAFTWRAAALCQESLQTNAAWCPAFDSTELGSSGTYEVQFRAVDAVGNESISAIYTLFADGAAPTVTSSYSGQWLSPLPDPLTELQWTLPLDVTATDPLIGTIAGSGVATSTIDIGLYDATGTLMGNGAPQPMVPVTLGSDVYTVDYAISNVRPLGIYSITVTVEDTVGNAISAIVGTVRLDEYPPAVDAYTSRLTSVISQTHVFSGTVHDLPDWSDALVQYHFEDAAGAVAFYDSSDNNTSATCMACPTLSDGVFGQAALFDGVTTYLEVPATVHTVTETFSAATWFYVETHHLGTMVQQRDGTGTGRAWLFLDAAGHVASNLASGLASPAPVTTGEWHHAAVTYDGATVRLYVNGGLVAELTATVHVSDGEFFLGAHKSLATSFFDGKLDETAIYAYVLADEEIYAMSRANVQGVSGVEVWVEPVVTFTDTLNGPQSEEWQSATVSGATWQYDLPTDVESLYQVHVRSDDNAGNSAEKGVVWRGLIDHIAPRVTFTGTHIISDTADMTEFTFTFDDYLLDEASWAHPCAPEDLIVTRYDEPDTPLDDRATFVSATCRVPGHATGEFSAATCDEAGLCTAVTIELGDPTAVRVRITVAKTGTAAWALVSNGLLALATLWVMYRRRRTDFLATRIRMGARPDTNAGHCDVV